MTDYPVLTATTFLPLAGAVLILLVGSDRLARLMALATTLATLAVSAPLYFYFDKGSRCFSSRKKPSAVKPNIPSVLVTCSKVYGT